MKFVLLQHFDECGDIPWIWDKNVQATLLDTDHRIHGKRENMIERQRADINNAVGFAFGPEANITPQTHLLYIGKNIAVSESRAF